MKTSFSFAAIIIIAFGFFSTAQSAPCPVGGCGGGDESWTASAQAFMNSEVPLIGVTANQETQSLSKNSSSYSSGSFKAGEAVAATIDKRANITISNDSPIISGVYVAPGDRADKFPAPSMLKPLDAISEKEVVLDVSNHRSPGQGHIRGSVNIPANSFFYENGTLRPTHELSAILGQAGVSSRSAVMVYSDTFGSGEATAVLWALLCLGHDNARALDGGLDNWIAASLPMETDENIRSPVSYVARPRSDYLADYDYVKSGRAQMVDCRSFQEYGKARIGNATFISPENALNEGRLKAGADLEGMFARLNASRPVVVYSNDINRASVVWFALQLMGFDAKIYTWQDWQAHEGQMA